MKTGKLAHIAGSLGLAFLMAALPVFGSTASAARNIEPSSCTKNGRIYAPEASSIVIDADTGNILSTDNIDDQRYPASMTKMMTTLLIFEALRDGSLKLDDEITMKFSDDVKATAGNSRSTWLKEGEKLTVEEAILAISVASANNVSVLIAETIAGSEASFVDLMNEKARALGMTNTLFKNSTGLPDRAQVSTARDIAKLALHLYQAFPEYYHYFSEEKAEFGPYKGLDSKGKSKAKYNHNELARKKGNNINGIKTGFICDAGYNLAASATDDGRSVISVVFGGRTPYLRNEKTKTLITQGFLILDARSNQSLANVANVNDNTATRFASNTAPTLNAGQ